MKARVVALALAAAALVAVAAYPRRETAAPAAVAQRDASPADAPRATPAAPRVSTPTTAASNADVLRPASLRGAVRDGRVTLGADGRVAPDLELRRLFDYYLSTIGELDPAQIRALMLDELRGEFSDAVLQQVLDVFDRYVAYERAVAGLDPGAIADPLERLAAMKKLRRQMLGDALADAFFGADERYADVAARKIEIAADPALSVADKQRMIDALDAELPPEVRAQREDADSAALLVAQQRQLASADPKTRHDERAALWGEDAAQRLAALDVEREKWDARVAAYRAANAADRAALLERSFTEPERRRILALEQAGAM